MKEKRGSVKPGQGMTRIILLTEKRKWMQRACHSFMPHTLAVRDTTLCWGRPRRGRGRKSWKLQGSRPKPRPERSTRCARSATTPSRPRSNTLLRRLTPFSRILPAAGEEQCVKGKLAEL